MEEEQTVLRKDKENGVWLNRGNQGLNVNTFKYFLSPLVLLYSFTYIAAKT